MRIALALVVACLCPANVLLALESPDDSRVNARMMQMPAVSATQIAFCYAGDIWIVPKTGGTALRLSSPKGAETFPRFSPDGKQIAFTANYEGNEDVYVMPVSGGEPRRITHHGAADRVLGWYPDGQSLLFASKMASFTDRVGQFHKVAAQGGLPEQLPIPYGEFAAVSPDGGKLAFTTATTDFAAWKRYRGGMAPDIWIYDLKTGAAENITADAANDSQPMWRGSTLYFLSDRDASQHRNIWTYDSETKAVRQVTHFTESDVHFPSMGPDDIVFETRGRLYLLDLSSEKPLEVDIQIISDRATLRPRVEGVSGLIKTATISPTGRRALFEARGDIFSVPTDHGVIRNLTETSGIAERYPAWSPDGRLVAYFSDRTGEYELTFRPADGRGSEETMTNLGPGWRYQPYWSPDSRKVVFIDGAMKLHLFDCRTRAVTVIEQQLWQYHGELERFRVSWSSDGRWLAYSRDQENRQDAIVLYDTVKAERHQVTSGFYDDDFPVFDPDGSYLYYRSKRSFEPIYSEFDNTWIYANGQVLVAVPLRQDVASPLAPRNDEEPVRWAARNEPREPERLAGDTPPRAESHVVPVSQPSPSGEVEQVAIKEQPRTPGQDAPAATPEPAAQADPKRGDTLRIHVDGFESRAVLLPISGGRFENLCATAGRLLFTRQPRAGSPNSPQPVCYYDVERRTEHEVLDDATGMELAADGRKLLVARGRSWAVVNIAENQRFERTLPVGQLEATIDPPAEWRQIFSDAWRIQRDFFYDPQLHGVDWKAMRETYGRLMSDCATRSDVNYVIGELLGELNASHLYRGGGDMDETMDRAVGYLGCDFAVEQGAFRIRKVLEVAPWEYTHRSPLRQPGVAVREGDWLLAVNGRPLDISRDPWASFQGLADRTVMLTVNDKPGTAGAREVLVHTIGDESRLRQMAWMEGNRKRVEAASGGQVGYIYVRNTGVEGQGDLYRQYRAQFAKQALIVDERWNSGGQIPDRFVELLGRRVTNFWGVRDGRDWQTPFVAHQGPKAMLVNGWSGSGGDCLPWMFRKAGLGPVIGQRTWGGLIGTTGAPGLIDGGHVTVPTFSIYDTEGQWIIEGSGVEPDIAVVDDPALLAKGADPQLERAVAEVLAELKKAPPVQPKRPPYPNRSGAPAGSGLILTSGK